jgi:O-antigen/teichoic acid export membrane protein
MIYGIYFSGLIFLLAQDLCQTLYGSQEAGQYLRLYALMIPMLYCDSITDAMIKGLGQQRISVRYNILTNILDILLLYFLLPHYGMYGYFVSFLLTHLLNFGLSLRRLLIICRERISLMQPLLGMIAMVPSVLIASMTGSLAGRITAYTGILTSLFFLFGIANRNDVKWLRGLIRKT